MTGGDYRVRQYNIRNHDAIFADMGADAAYPKIDHCHVALLF